MKIYYDTYEIEEKYCYNLRFVDDLYKNHFTLDILIRNYKESEFKEMRGQGFWLYWSESGCDGR